MSAHRVETVGRQVPALFGPDTMVVPMQNGIPYWYFHRYPGALAGTRVKSVDTSGVVSEHIPCERDIGCVVYSAPEMGSPGGVEHVGGNRVAVGHAERHSR